VGRDIPLFEFTGTGLRVYDNLIEAPDVILDRECPEDCVSAPG